MKTIRKFSANIATIGATALALATAGVYAVDLDAQGVPDMSAPNPITTVLLYVCISVAVDCIRVCAWDEYKARRTERRRATR